MPLRWLRDGLRARGQQAGHPFPYARATLNHSNAPLHKADWAASQDTILRNTPPGPSHAQLIVAGNYGHLNLRRPKMRTLTSDRAAGTDGLCADATRAHTSGRGPRQSLYPPPGPRRDTHQQPGAAGQGLPHAGATQAPRPKGAAPRRRHPPAAVPLLRQAGGESGAHARWVRPLPAPVAPLPPGG